MSQLTLTKAILRTLSKRPRSAEYLAGMAERHNLSDAKDKVATVNVTLYRLQAKGKTVKNGKRWSLAESVPVNGERVKRKYTKRVNKLATFIDKVNELLALQPALEALIATVKPKEVVPAQASAN